MSNSRKIASLPNVLTLLDDAGGEFLAQQAAATTTSYTVTWPAAVGGSGALLGTTNSAGAMGWLTALSGLTINNSIIGGSTPAAITGTTVTATSNFVGDITGDVTGNADTATTLATPRTFSITGDGTSTFAAFNGSANVSGALTLATVNSNVGSFGSATAVPVITVNAKGLVTAVSTASVSSVLTVAADSGSDDTVTLGTDTLTFAGTANEIETTVSDNQIQIGLPSTILTTTQSAGDNSTKVATTAYVDIATAALVDSAPSTLDTLNELAAALGDDPNFATTVTSSVAAKLPLAGGTMTGDIELNDDVKASFGTSQDLEIYHDGTDSYISDVGTGGLKIVGNNLKILGSSATNYEQKAEFQDNGAVNLSYSGTTRFSTNVTGIYVNGFVLASGMESASFKGFHIGSHILPTANQTTTDDTVDLGSSSYRFRQIHGTELHGTLQTAAQPNITSLGTLTGLTVSSAISGNVTGSAATVTGSSQTAITSVGTLSSLAVSGDLTVDTNTLKVDTTNNRVGILDASPDVTLDMTAATDAVGMPVGTTAQRPSSPEAGYFRYNTTLSKFEGYTDEWGEIGGGGGSTSLNIDTMTGDGSDTTLTLSVAPNNENHTQVYFDGVYQSKANYSVSGTTLTFSTAPATGVEVEVMTVSPTTINVPADDSVTTAKLTSNSVTTAKILDDNVTAAKLEHSINLVGNPTTTTQSASDNSTKIATTAYVETAAAAAAAAVVDSAPSTLDTLNELAAALGDDANFSTTVTTSIAAKLPLAGGTMTGLLTAAAKLKITDVGNATVAGLQLTDAGLGISSPSADQMNFITADTTRMVIDSSGNVGIGTSSPSSYPVAPELVVDTGVKGGITVVSDSTTGGYGGVFFADGTTGNEQYRGFIQYNHNNGGSVDDLLLGTAGAESMRIDSSGNVGIGLTPHNWAVGRALELGFEGNALWGNAADEVIVVQNGYYDGAWKYATTRKATHYSQYDGTHRWFYAPSGNADSAISWNTAMTIDNSGNVGIGLTSNISSKLHINSEMSFGPDGDNRAILGYASNAFTIGTRQSATNYFSTVTVTGGSVGIGTSSMDGRLKISAPAGNSASADLTLWGNNSGAYGGTNIAKSKISSVSDGTAYGANLLFYTNDTSNSYQEAMRIDSSGDVGIGNSTVASTKFAVTGSVVGANIETTSSTAGHEALIVNRQNSDGTVIAINKAGTTVGHIGTTGGKLYIGSSDGSDAFLRFESNEISPCTHEGSFRDNVTHLGKTDSRFKNLHMSGIGFFGLYSATGVNDGNIMVGEGIYVGAANGNNQIRTSSAGGGSATLYIGNAAIQVSSDQRLKTNIVDTELNALEKVNQVRVVDFNWDDPSDTSFNNRNARGKWTGVLAQELVDVLPFAVNAPRNESDLSIDTESEQKWLVDQAQMVPVLIKAIQEQQTLIESLTDRIAALEQ